jgi:hypothetical protein
MASGFIVLGDGRCCSVRWQVHDGVVAAVAATLDERDPLRVWLVEQLPKDGDVELGYGFVRHTDGEHVVRHVDVRGLTPQNQVAFEEAAMRTASTPGEHAADIAIGLERLREMVRRRRAAEPALELSDWTSEAPACTARIGPGWTGD